MLNISLFTPTHDSKWLSALYESIKDQPFYEWVIVYNNGAKVIEFDDPRVKSFVLPVAPEWVGPLKAYACEQCTGDILLEMDHDDMLTPGAIQKLSDAYEANPDVGFVYTNAFFIDGEGKPTPRFSDGFGWEYRVHEVDGKPMEELVSFPPTPCSCSRIWFAPNHIRSFRRSLYEEVGGYSKGMRVLDDQDIMSRMYIKSRFYLLDEPLYIYRVHGENSWMKHNAEIQQNVWRIYDLYIDQMARKWAEDNGLLALELGGRMNAAEGFTTVDLRDADITANLDERWPFEDGSVGVVRAHDVFEHLKNPLHTMRELHRVLAPGGYALIQVPSTDGRGAFQDPTHVSFWNENSFLYYTNEDFAKFVDYDGLFKPMRLYTTQKDARQVCWTVAHLIKPGGVKIPDAGKLLG